MIPFGRFVGTYNRLSDLACKVYGCTTINEPWTAQKIEENFRSVFGEVDSNYISECLRTLCLIGLVSEPRPGFFMREPVENIFATRRQA